MKNRMTVVIHLLLVMLCGCGREAPDMGSTAAFLAARADSVIAAHSDVSEESARQYLQGLDSKVEKNAVIPGEGLTTVKYHTGLSHSREGMIVNGSKGGNPEVPPDKSYYHEFHYDREGKLSHIVENNEGARALSNLFYYDGTNPVARICFVQGKHSYSDLACYTEGEMFFKCRIASDGNVLASGLITTQP